MYPLKSLNSSHFARRDACTILTVKKPLVDRAGFALPCSVLPFHSDQVWLHQKRHRRQPKNDILWRRSVPFCPSVIIAKPARNGERDRNGTCPSYLVLRKGMYLQKPGGKHRTFKMHRFSQLRTPVRSSFPSLPVTSARFCPCEK